jgi:hypothetical protein
MDVNRKPAIDKIQPRNQCITIANEDQCTTKNMQNVGSGAAI